MIQVNEALTKTREPKEYNLKVSGQKGKIVHRLPDGYSLVKFEHLKFKKMIRWKKGKMMPLQWYIHREDYQKINPATLVSNL